MSSSTNLGRNASATGLKAVSMKIGRGFLLMSSLYWARETATLPPLSLMSGYTGTPFMPPNSSLMYLQASIYPGLKDPTTGA